MAQQTIDRLRLATTSSIRDSGLLDHILPEFERRHGIRVQALSLGTGKALEAARRNQADVVLVHAPELEDRFVAAGEGVDRREVMYNDFVIVGPADDRAGVRGADSAAEAFGRIAAARAKFISRGDDSGTHHKERDLWARSGTPDPQGDWYERSGRGMADTLQLASGAGAYTLTDRATCLALGDDILLEVLHEGDPRLRNPYSVIAVNPDRHRVNREAASRFVAFITSPEEQRHIAAFGVDRYGRALFFPSAVSGKE